MDMCDVHACEDTCAHGPQRTTSGIFHDHSEPCFESGPHIGWARVHQLPRLAGHWKSGVSGFSFPVH